MDTSTLSRSGHPAPSSGESPAVDDLVTIMARLADGDGRALVDLLEAHGAQIGRVIGGIARSRGARLRTSEHQELLLEAALVIAELAAAWDPAGAPPWVWAYRRLAAVVDRHLGQWARSLDDPGVQVPEDPVPVGAFGEEPALAELLEHLGAQHPSVALLAEATRRVASDRDQLVFFETAVQVSLGDRSPAVTVGRLLGMRPATVRQQHRRVRTRLLQLAAAEERFAPLAELPVLRCSAA